MMTARRGAARPYVALAHAGVCLSTAVAFSVHVHLIPMLLDRGYSLTLAATLVGLVSAVQVLDASSWDRSPVVCRCGHGNIQPGARYLAD